ncbi:MAG TPA: DUF1127 domain-containing protein [Aestuariivirgaceae bacterium]|nr:DUF1127 domain-containing protein [Aestuariivirgaceae bacterium]
MATMSFEREGIAAPTRTLPNFLSRIAGGVRGYLSRAEAERQLEALDERLLNDIGLKRSEIHRMVWGGGR